MKGNDKTGFAIFRGADAPLLGDTAVQPPPRPIDGGMPTEALIVHVVVSKFCDSLPLYRQSQMLARQGITLDRSTLSNWVGTACWWLTPIYDLMVATVLSSPKIFADDTTLPVLDPGRGRTKTGYLWALARDDRPETTLLWSAFVGLVAVSLVAPWEFRLPDTRGWILLGCVGVLGSMAH